MMTFLLPAAIALLLVATAAPTTAPTGAAARPGWRLVWSDEFDRPNGAAPDPAKWQYELGYLRNAEKQYYTKDRRENVRVEDGNLIIEARKETYPIPGQNGKTAEYTAGSIETYGPSNTWQYGRIEVRAKIPTGRGMWPAIWMLPPTIGQPGHADWPECGEIDIMENVGYDPHVLHGTVHTGAYNHVKKTEKGKQLRLERPWENYHVYAVEWDAKKIDFLIDDVVYNTFENDGKNDPMTWPFDQPFNVKLNTAVGGGWGGRKGIDDSVFPTKFYIDYVRVYQRDGK
jgi:beta-glucanase (GH16 family)